MPMCSFERQGLGIGYRAKLQALTRELLKLLAPGTNFAQSSREATGTKPWDFRETITYGSAAVGCEETFSQSAFDSSSGTVESISVSISSFGLPAGSGFTIRDSCSDQHPNDPLTLTVEGDAAACDAVESRLDAVLRG